MKKDPLLKYINSTNIIIIGIITLGILNKEFSEIVIAGLLGFLKNVE